MALFPEFLEETCRHTGQAGQNSVIFCMHTEITAMLLAGLCEQFPACALPPQAISDPPSLMRGESRKMPIGNSFEVALLICEFEPASFSC